MATVRTAKRRRLSPPVESQTPKTYDVHENFLKHASRWNLEQDYEQRPRKLKKKNKKNQKLPIKTSEGWIEQEAEDSEDGAESDHVQQTGNVEELATKMAEKGRIAKTSESATPNISSRQQITEAKEELARIASLINEDPEEHIGSLKKLGQIALSTNLTVKKLALATQLAVYKDVIPGYRIRPLPEEDLKGKLSKDVRKLRTFEQSIVAGYQAYLRELALSAKRQPGESSEQAAGLIAVATSCACNLLLAVPHFNFRGELLKILVGKMSSRKVNPDLVKCRDTLEELFREDEDGDASLEAVLMLTKMVKSKDYEIHQSVINSFLHLRLLSEFSQRASTTKVDREEIENRTVKPAKKKWEFRTKRMRKQMKEEKLLRKEMKEADAAVSHEDRDKNQAEMLKAIFLVYLRILKAKNQNLMGAVLEGLAKYAHLINQDFFGDILETLKELIQQAELSNPELSDPNQVDIDNDDIDEPFTNRNATRESLLCVSTAFALLHGQDARKSASELHLDLSFFTTHLYRTLLPLSLNPDIELSTYLLSPPSSISPSSNPSSQAHAAPANQVNYAHPSTLLLRALQHILLPQGPAPLPSRLAAFTHRLLLTSLHTPSSSSAALLALLERMTAHRGRARTVSALWRSAERRGDGVCDLGGGSVEGCNGFAGTVWEGEVLRMHFDERVREEWKGLERNIAAVGEK